MRNKSDNTPINTEHGLWGKRSSAHPFHKAFKSTLCVSAAALVIASVSAQAGVVTKDVDSEINNSQDIIPGSTSVNTSPSNTIGLEVLSSAAPANVDFTNEGNIDLDYEANNNVWELTVTGIESVVDSTVTVDNQGEISASATAVGRSYSDRQIGVIGIDTSGEVINDSTINTYASAENSKYGNSVEATAISADGSVVNTGIIASVAVSGDSEKYYSYADASGIKSGDQISNTTSITITAMSGDTPYYSPYEDNRDSVAKATALDAYTKVDNTGNITVNATSGSADGSSSASAKGIYTYSYDNETNVNSGNITVKATSGSAGEDSNAEAVGIYSYYGNIDNSGQISVTSQSGSAESSSYSTAEGINAWYELADNSNTIDVTAESGSSGENSEAIAYGIYAWSGANNEGEITVNASSGEAGNTSSAQAYGIASWDDDAYVTNTADITVTATSGDSTSYYSYSYEPDPKYAAPPSYGAYNSSAMATGLSTYGEVDNSGKLTVAATSGSSLSGNSEATATGIYALYDVVNTSDISVSALSEDAGYNSSTYAGGIFSEDGSVTNSGSITISSASGYAGDNSGATAQGIYAEYDINNSGSIDITVSSGDFGRYSFADAQGLEADDGSIVNDASITIEATSGQAGDISWADAEGLNAVTDLENSGAVRVIATSGDAGFISDTEAEGLANDYGYLTNTGSITVEATSGNAYNSMASAVAIESESEYIVTNQGDISVSAQSGTADKYGSATAQGISLQGSESSTIDNTGNVYVSAHSGQAMESTAASIGISVANRDYYEPDYYAPFTAAALPAEPTPGSTLVNSGNITVIATSDGSGEIDEAERSMAFAGAIGLSANGTVENSGAIAVTGTAADSGYIVTEVVGINTGAQPYIGGGGKRAKRIAPSYYGGDVFNSSAITVTSTTGDGYAIRQNARGINAYGDVTNDGTIQVTATSGSAAYDNSIQAMGIYSTGDVTNSGSITVDATRGDSGYFSYGYGEGLGELNGGAGIFAYGSIDNAGDITVTTTNGNLLTTGPEPASANAAMAAGLVSFYGDVTNTGNITVDVATGNSYGSKNVSAAFGIVGTYGGNITNEGTITVAARTGASTNPDDAMSMAAGIMLFNGGTVHSSGLINVTADSGYQVMNVGGNVATMTGFAMEFGASQELLDEMYTGCLGGNIAFSDDAMLYVYAGDGMFEGENTYLIPVLLEEDVDGGIERGYFADYQFATASPYYEITYMSPKSDGELQEISIEFSPEIASPQYAASVRNFMFDQMNGIVKNSLFTPVLSHMLTGDPTQITYDGVLLASTNPIPDTSSVITQTPRKKSSVFVQPFYTDTSNSSDPMGYDADIYGLTGGYNYHVNGNLIVGVHAGYGNADVDYSGTGYDFRSEDIDSISFGVHGIHRFADNWLGTATATFFYTDNDYMDQSPTNRETADYNTYGTEANIDLGYIFNFGNHHIIPEIGLTYLWQHNESYTTDNLDNQDITFGSMDEHELYARLGVSWYGNFIQEKWQIVPNLSIGLEEALTDGELSSTMSNGRAITTVESDFGDTTFTANAGIEFSNDQYTFAVGYAGSYSSDLSDSSIFLQAVYRF